MFSRTLAVTVAAMFLTACGAESQAQAQQFNLVCVGENTLTRLSDRQPVMEPSKYEATYRIDLIRGKWCVFECEKIDSVVEISDNELVLWKHREFGTQLNPNGEVLANITVNRLTGAFYADLNDGTTLHETVAKCQRRPFTGLPPQLF